MTKYENLYNELCRICKETGAGAAIPSVRELMWRFKVSQITVDKAMEKMRAESLIETVPGEGSFVKQSLIAAPRSHLRLALLVHNYPSSFANMIEKEIVKAVGESGHYIEVFRYDWNRPVLFGHRPKGFDGIMVIPSRQFFPEEDAEALKKLAVPFVVLSTASGSSGINSVSTDNLLGGGLACDGLLRLGHRKLAVLVSEPCGNTINERVRGFNLQAAVAGLSAPLVIDCKMHPGENSFEKAHIAIKEVLRGNRHDFTGLFVVSDASALGALHGLYEEGLNVPDDISVIGFDDIPESSFFIPPLSTLRQDCGGWALKAIEIIKRELDSGRDSDLMEHIVLPPRLVIRKSTSEYRCKYEKTVHAD